MKNNDTFDPYGTLLERITDYGDGTGIKLVYDLDGTLLESEELTGLPIFPTYPSLDGTGALATLLVVEGALALSDAANAVDLEEEHLISEAEAWSLG